MPKFIIVSVPADDLAMVSDKTFADTEMTKLSSSTGMAP